MPNPVHESIRRLAARSDIILRRSRVLVAVSGGQDSCALLHGFAALREELGVELHIAHLNHGFRGDEADADAEFVRAFAKQLGIPSTVATQDVPGMAARLRISNQVAARRARHEFLDRTADSIGAARIALGHTRDDKIETVLMNVVRGTGIDGLVGLSAASGRRIRPLLEVSRDETAAYCRANGIPFHEDASNLSTAYTRNRVRAELLPLLQSRYHPGVRNAILRLADLAEQDSAVLNDIAERALRDSLLNRTDARIVLSTERMRLLPAAIQRRALRAAILEVRGDLVDVDAGTIERTVMALTAGRRGRFQFTLPNGDISVEVTGLALGIAKMVPDCDARRVEHVLPIPGSVLTPEFHARFEIRFVGRAADVGANSADHLYLDVDAVSLPIIVRNRRLGDRLRPAGLGGSKKVQDILTDAKVPAANRDAVPIVADSRGILWVVGHAADERCVIDQSAECVAVIERIAQGDS